MTSILTNVSAMVALQTLRGINNDLDMTNNRVSTGLRIATAADSSAYWAISTVTRSDNSALGAVKDALGVGRTLLDVAYEGLDAVREGIDTIKTLVVSARSPGINRANIQVEIAGIVADLTTKANSSVINEQNLLVGDSTADPATREVVASFERSATGIAISTIDLTVISPGTPDQGTLLIDTGGTDGILNVDRTTTGGLTDALVDIDISTLTDSTTDLQELEDWLEIADAALQDVIGAQNRVGAILKRIDTQTEFIMSLIDANDRSIGTLVDADMEAESTKLRALQTQQQLAIQSLSIANGSSQNILALFRN